MSQTCNYCQKVVSRACQSVSEEDDCKQRQRRGRPAGLEPQIFAPARGEIIRALQAAHGAHSGFSQGGNFLACGSCRLSVKWREPHLTWTPPRARKEHEIRTLEDVQRTVRR